MNKFSDLIISKEFSLPDYFFNKKYNNFLFFDFSLSNNYDFLKYFNQILLLNNYLEIDVYTSIYEDPVLSIDLEEKDIIPTIRKIYDEEYYFTGTVVIPPDLSWCAAQYYPVDWGVFAFNTHNKESQSLFDSLDKNWFVTISQLKKSLHDRSSFLYDEFGEDGITAILNNYA